MITAKEYYERQLHDNTSVVGRLEKDEIIDLMEGYATEKLKVHLPTVVSRWVDIKESPKYTDWYNVHCSIGSMHGGYYEVRTYRYEKHNDKWIIPYDTNESVKVTHWQELPKKPNV